MDAFHPCAGILWGLLVWTHIFYTWDTSLDCFYKSPSSSDLCTHAPVPAFSKALRLPTLFPIRFYFSQFLYIYYTHLLQNELLCFKFPNFFVDSVSLLTLKASLLPPEYLSHSIAWFWTMQMVIPHWLPSWFKLNDKIFDLVSATLDRNLARLRCPSINEKWLSYNPQRFGAVFFSCLQRLKV